MSKVYNVWYPGDAITKPRWTNAKLPDGTMQEPENPKAMTWKAAYETLIIRCSPIFQIRELLPDGSPGDIQETDPDLPKVFVEIPGLTITQLSYKAHNPDEPCPCGIGLMRKQCTYHRD